MDLVIVFSVFWLLVDFICVCLLVVLEGEELIVVEFVVVLYLVQLCVFIYLVKLKEVNLVCDCCVGVLVYYCVNIEGDEYQYQLLKLLCESIDDVLLCEDVVCIFGVFVQCVWEVGWVDIVVGDMECYYLFGCIWEILVCLLLQLLEIGDVLDIVFGDGIIVELLVLYVCLIVCIDFSECVVEVVVCCLQVFFNVEVCQGDMQVLDLGEWCFDLVLMLYVLIYVVELVVVVV